MSNKPIYACIPAHSCVVCPLEPQCPQKPTSHGWTERPDAYHGALVDDSITALARAILLEHTSVRGWASETLLEYGCLDRLGEVDPDKQEFYPRGRRALILWLDEDKR